MKLKDKLPEMSEEEQLALLATDGMLVKRPILVAEDKILVGAKEKRVGRVSDAMKKKLNYIDIIKETVILTVAVAIIARRYIFSWYQAIHQSAVFPVLESCFPTLCRCSCRRLP